MPSQLLDARRIVVFVACCMSLAVAGCAKRSVTVTAPVTSAPLPSDASNARPMTVAPDTDAAPPVDAPASPPSLPVAAAPPPITLATGKPPAPHRVPTDRPAQEPVAHPPAPQISPQLSPGDRATYERTTEQDLGVSEGHLQEAAGRRLSAAQKDLVDKIRSFISQSHDASSAGDWARAQNLAQKARLLSQELHNSF